MLHRQLPRSRDPEPRAARTPHPRPGSVPSILADNVHRKVFVPQQLARQVFLHLLMNYLPWTRGNTPLVLGIAGRFGVGKSTIVREICQRLDFHVEVLNASSLESKWAGEPGERIKAAYLKAAEYQSQKNTGCVLIMDDLDLALGQFEEFSSGTSHTKQAISAFMEFADHPTLMDGRPVDRVPIIATCNDLTKLYGALPRPGRMRAINWEPTREDTLQIATHILRDLLSEDQLLWLAGVTESWTVAHFGQLRSTILESIVEHVYQDIPAKDCIRAAFENQNLSCPQEFDVTQNMLVLAVQSIESSVRTARTDYTGTC